MRIQLVASIGIGLAALFVAFIGAPMVAVLVWPTPEVTNNVDAITSSFEQASRIAIITNRVSFGALAVAGLSFFYALSTAAVWFIGPKDSNRSNGD